LLEAALSMYIDGRRDIPKPSPVKRITIVIEEAA
jgi:hypothetical protein